MRVRDDFNLKDLDKYGFNCSNVIIWARKIEKEVK